MSRIRFLMTKYLWVALICGVAGALCFFLGLATVGYIATLAGFVAVALHFYEVRSRY